MFDDFLYVVFFYFLLVCSIILLALGAHSLARYRRGPSRDDLAPGIITLLAGLIILGANLGVVHPLTNYDSVRYMVEIQTNGTTSIVLPWPDERGLLGELETVRGSGEWKVVDTEKGLGLEVRLDDYLHFEGKYITGDHDVVYEPELMEDGHFWVFYETEDSSTRGWVREFRIVHQSPDDFHSKQIFQWSHGGEWFEEGWNLVKFEVYDDRN